MKLQVHNFTVYRLNDADIQVYVWHKCNGGVAANEFSSCIVHYISSLSNEVHHVILVSDGCSYQNRNRVLSNALSQMAKEEEQQEQEQRGL